MLLVMFSVPLCPCCPSLVLQESSFCRRVDLESSFCRRVDLESSFCRRVDLESSFRRRLKRELCLESPILGLLRSSQFTVQVHTSIGVSVVDSQFTIQVHTSRSVSVDPGAHVDSSCSRTNGNGSSSP